MALDTTVGGDSSDSYASLAEIKTKVAVLYKIQYYATLMKSLQAVNDDVLEELARIATNNLDSFNYAGVRLTSSQARAWPRTGPRLSMAYRNVIPAEVKTAQVLEMAQLNSTVANTDQTIENSIAAGVQSESMGARSVTYRKPAAILNKQNLSKLAREVLDRANLLSNNVYMPRG